MDLNKVKKVYLIGIKGVGMTMIAQYLSEQGIIISGSDTAEKFMTDEVLKNAGIKVTENFNKNNIPDDADLIIYSSAYNENNEEVAAALDGKINTITYAQALGMIFNNKYGIAVAGSHGKTTTTAWLGFVMEKARLNPSVMVGANVPQFKGTSLAGKSDYLLIEADEYQNKLKYFEPKAVLLNNIDYDHPDFFLNEEDYKQVFIEFIKKIPSRGFLVANFDDKNIKKIANVNCRGKVISYAINETADYIAFDIKNEYNKQFFKVKFGSDWQDSNNEITGQGLLGEFSIQLPGRHNVYNALAVIAAGIELNIKLFDIRNYLEEFSGTTRRLQILGEYMGATLIDDYAHHPTEIKATIEALRQQYKDKKIIVVFHPHTFTRTKILIDDFAKSFDLADEVIVLDIYGSAREKQGGVHSQDLVDKIALNKQWKIKPKNISTLALTEKYLRNSAQRGDIIVLMGAGDVFRIGENLLK